ncbi:MAG: hypothetical protein AAF467_09735 [Actinomycetota bacterium]
MRQSDHRWYLLPSPLLGPASWRAVSDVLGGLGQQVMVAHPPMTTTADSDHVTPWIESIAGVPAPSDDLPVVVVGHSAACPRVPMATARLIERGWNVSALVCVDGRFPDGRPFTATDSYGAMLDGLVHPDGYLPPWPRWWGSLVEGLVVDPVARDQVFSEARPVPRGYFDQGCPVPTLPEEVGRAFLSFGPGYEEACNQAHLERWMTYRLVGDHLHQVVEPAAVAATLMAMVSCMEAGRAT